MIAAPNRGAALFHNTTRRFHAPNRLFLPLLQAALAPFPAKNGVTELVNAWPCDCNDSRVLPARLNP